MKKYLLYENMPRNCEVEIKENKEFKDKKDYFIQGIYIQAEERNQNGRVYPYHIIKNEVEKFKNDVKNKFRCTGELDHPKYVDLKLQKAVHNIISLEWDKKNSKKYVLGKSKILDPNNFPKSKIVIGLIKEGIVFGMSTRGVGDMNDNGIITEFQLITVDIVADPSAQPAIIEAVYENRNKWFKQGIIDLSKLNQIEKISNNKIYKEMKKSKEYLHKYFRDFLNR